VGIKVCMVLFVFEIMGMEMLKLVWWAARESGMWLMVHIGDMEKCYDLMVIRKFLLFFE